MSSGRTGKIVDERWQRLQELFSRAVELPESEREQFVNKQTEGDAELRTELLELLACDTGRATGPLTHALGAALDLTTRDRRKALVGRVIGNYKLVSVLGHGGTGTVYLGERADRQYSAQVAVKIVDSATVHGDLGMRFRAERQILASLNHANIARLLDAGETSDGQPYLVMEYVHGEPLDRYCDRQQLDLRTRLQLFLDICTAVQYAHQNLIVHRDLKPANILVTVEGAPKLLDFGIAKLLDTGDAAAVLALTRMNDRLLTPEYASPEQILGRAVTTASDVYALGVVLYELLTGLRPYVVPASASQLELERSICVTDPLRPSSVIRRAMESGPIEGQSEIAAIASARRLTPDKLQRRLIGDIDAIIMRALRKEPQHRYGSVDQFAADVRRFLNREPVVARQGNWLYYSQRFVRRHAFGVSASAASVMFIIAFAVAMSIQTQRIAAERDRVSKESETAEAVSDFMEGVFSQADPYVVQGKRELTARELLEKAGKDIRDNLQQQPEVRARLLEAIGRAFRRRGDPESAVRYLEDAVHIRKQMPNGGGREVTVGMAELAIVLRLTGDVEGSERTLKEALQLSGRLGAERSPIYASLLTNLGRIELDKGNLALARRYFEESLQLNRELLGPHDREVAAVLFEMARLFTWTDELDAAERAAEESVKILRDSVPERHPDRVLAEARLGEVLFVQNRINDAAPIFERTLEAEKLLFGENSQQVADILDSLAQIRRAQGQLEQAEDYQRRALQSHAIAMGQEHYTTAYYRTSLAALLLRRARYGEAEKLLTHSLETYSRVLTPDHPYVASAEHVLGEVYLATNRLSAAEAMLSAAMNRLKRTNAAEWRIARSASALGEVLYREGRAAEAEAHLTDSYRKLAADQGADREARVKARQRVERFYTERGERNKLEALMLATSRDIEPSGVRHN
jgi:serine/threonine protein kinase/tetratricopeptide (TPR) repeat protein